MNEMTGHRRMGFTAYSLQEMILNRIGPEPMCRVSSGMAGINPIDQVFIFNDTYAVWFYTRKIVKNVYTAKIAYP